MSLTRAPELADAGVAERTGRALRPKASIVRPGSAAAAQVAFRKSRKSLREIVIAGSSFIYSHAKDAKDRKARKRNRVRMTARSHLVAFEGATDRAFFICFMKPLAILPAAVPNSEFTFPPATTNLVLWSTTSYGYSVVKLDRRTVRIRSAASLSLVMSSPDWR